MYDAQLFELTRHVFRLFSFAFLFAGFSILASSFFTALDNGLISAAILFFADACVPDIVGYPAAADFFASDTKPVDTERTMEYRTNTSHIRQNQLRHGFGSS